VIQQFISWIDFAGTDGLTRFAAVNKRNGGYPQGQKGRGLASCIVTNFKQRPSDLSEFLVF
jgi:hypothetical protein